MTVPAPALRLLMTSLLASWVLYAAPVGAQPSAGVLLDLRAGSGDDTTPSQLCGASWNAISLPPATGAMAPPRAALAAVEDAYVEADHLGCLERVVVAALNPDRLLTAELRAVAARREALEAACAHGAGDGARAERVIDRLLTRELFSAEAMAGTTPELQALVETRRAALAPATPVTVEWTVDVDVSVSIDGAPRCDALPCHVSLRPGAHVLTAQALGYAREVHTPDIEGTAMIALPFEPASAGALRDQLADRLASGGAVDTSRVLALLASAFDARFVRVRTPDGAQVLYDAEPGRVLARSSMEAGAAEQPSSDAEAGLAGSCPAVEASEPIELWVGIGVGAAVLLGVVIGLAAWGASQSSAPVWEIRF